MRDTIISTEPDSATLWALIECDSLGRAYLRELDTERGRRTALEAQIINNGRISALRVRADVAQESRVVTAIEQTSTADHVTHDSKMIQTTQVQPISFRRVVEIFISGAVAGALLAFYLCFRLK